MNYQKRERRKKRSVYFEGFFKDEAGNIYVAADPAVPEDGSLNIKTGKIKKILPEEKVDCWCDNFENDKIHTMQGIFFGSCLGLVAIKFLLNGFGIAITDIVLAILVVSYIASLFCYSYWLNKENNKIEKINKFRLIARFLVGDSESPFEE